MPKRSNIEISKELRLKTIVPILEGKEIDEIAKELGVSVKGLKYRLTLIYKYYNVKNRIQLMALYTNIPTPFRRFVKGVKRKTYKVSKVTSADAQERFADDGLLPTGLKL